MEVYQPLFSVYHTPVKPSSRRDYSVHSAEVKGRLQDSREMGVPAKSVRRHHTRIPAYLTCISLSLASIVYDRGQGT